MNKIKPKQDPPKPRKKSPEYNTTISMEENQTQLSNVLKSTEELNLKNPNSSPEVLNEEK